MYKQKNKINKGVDIGGLGLYKEKIKYLIVVSKIFIRSRDLQELNYSLFKLYHEK